mmetsp:Transcript_1946/g.7403  ORF Transcript_1946/g.7403 Transcript_1946/m.7403 type:complete len:211 (+) Transcript_1946:1283-1915(+)
MALVCWTFGSIGQCVAEQRVEHDPQREGVCLEGIVGTGRRDGTSHLGSRVARRGRQRLRRVCEAVAADNLGLAVVAELDLQRLLVLEQAILQLEVAMGHTFGVTKGHGIHDLPEDDLAVALSKGLPPGHDGAEKVAASAQLRDQVELMCRLREEDVPQPQDAWVLLAQQEEDLDLAPEPGHHELQGVADEQRQPPRIDDLDGEVLGVGVR